MNALYADEVFDDNNNDRLEKLPKSANKDGVGFISEIYLPVARSRPGTVTSVPQSCLASSFNPNGDQIPAASGAALWRYSKLLTALSFHSSNLFLPQHRCSILLAFPKTRNSNHQLPQIPPSREFESSSSSQRQPYGRIIYLDFNLKSRRPIPAISSGTHPSAMASHFPDIFANCYRLAQPHQAILG